MQSLRTAKGERGVIALKCDNTQVGDFGLLCDGYAVWLSEQPLGEPRKQAIEIPKKVFDKLVDFYTGNQKE